MDTNRNTLLRCTVDEDAAPFAVAADTLLRVGSPRWNYYQRYQIQVNGISWHGQITEPTYRNHNENRLLVSPTMAKILGVSDQERAEISISNRDPVTLIRYEDELDEEAGDVKPVVEGMDVQAGDYCMFEGDLIRIIGCQPKYGYIDAETAWIHVNSGREDAPGKIRTLGQTSSRNTANGLENLVGKDEQRLKAIKQAVILPLQQPDLAREHLAGPLSGVILHGPPGVGRKTVATAIGEELGWAALYIHEGEMKDPELIKEKYRQAQSKKNGCLLVIDGIPAVHPAAGDREPSWLFTLQQCLDEIQKDDSILTIGIARHLAAVPHSLRHVGRFELSFEIELPNRGQRVDLLKYFLSPVLQPHTRIDFTALADHTEGCSAADLEYLVRQAAFQELMKANAGAPDGGITTEGLLEVATEIHSAVAAAILYPN